MRRALLVALATAASCTGGQAATTTPASPASSPSPSASVSADPSGPTASPEPTTTESVDPETFVRTCDSSVYGDLGPRFRGENLTVGPITFVGSAGYETAPPRFFQTAAGRFRPQKILVVVERGSPVTVSITPRSRRFASLAYDPALFNRRFDDPSGGHTTVTFEPCGGDQPRTQFNGAFVVDAPRCVHLVITYGGTTARGVAAFARACG
jgi:hypothetical protein